MLLNDSIGPGSHTNIVPFQDSKKAKTMNKFKTNTTVDVPESKNNNNYNTTFKSGLDLKRNNDTDEENYRAILNGKVSTSNVREINTSSAISRQGHSSRAERKQY